jgi:hypothetical protein
MVDWFSENVLIVFHLQRLYSVECEGKMNTKDEK